MTKGVQPPRNKAENQTEDRTPILYEAMSIRHNNGRNRNYNAVCVEWRCNSFICCAAFGDIFVTDTGKSYDILEGREKVMGKIFDKNNKLIKKDDLYSAGTVMDFLEENDISCEEWYCLSDLIKTMTGNSATPFDTIEEMLKYIPNVLLCSEDCHFLEVYDNGRDVSKWYVLGWGNDDNEKMWNGILQEYFPGYKVVED